MRREGDVARHERIVGAVRDQAVLAVGDHELDRRPGRAVGLPVDELGAEIDGVARRPSGDRGRTLGVEGVERAAVAAALGLDGALDLARIGGDGAAPALLERRRRCSPACWRSCSRPAPRRRWRSASPCRGRPSCRRVARGSRHLRRAPALAPGQAWPRRSGRHRPARSGAWPPRLWYGCGPFLRTLLTVSRAIRRLR